ncbi:indolepyruvate ferredoxin oxidoreductase subunit alpha [Desulfotomaculum sp. 1211_IL3151]|uniref:indolepyruvate ferredoxin oxidoreductase subunit alpha n=1 Tax=Desulfotomaculum sp. 1211_IL3151 TaxID=3084055 RepID=UPI002FD8B76F
MYMVSINQDNCIGCADCIDACPAGLLGLEDGKCEIIGDAAECMGCETCTGICPNECFSIMEL